jgi:dihydrofolate reductase
MPKLRAHNLAISLDGYLAGPDQRLENPLGVGGRRLHDWVFATRTWNARNGDVGGETGVDDDFIARGDEGIGATIIGRNMFGPVRGPWGDREWRGWWGDNPPYHHPVFVLTHYPRPELPMEGGTTFTFVEGIEEALGRAFDAAAGADVRVGGGASTVQQYLRAGLVDELHIAIVPIFLGAGERLFDDIGPALDGYECAELVASPNVVHVRLVRAGA